jgi:hypothetical protein
MESIELVLGYLAGLHPAIPVALAALGGLVVVAQVVVTLTPSPVDNAWLAKLESWPVVGAILKGVKSFAPIQKK